MRQLGKYRLKYDLKYKAGAFTKEELGKQGGTDALVMGSCIFPHDGSYSQTFWSIDGRNGGKPLSDHDIFKFWIMMGAALGDPDRKLDEGRRMFASSVARQFFDMVKKPT